MAQIPDGSATPYDEAERQSSAKMVSELLNESLDNTEKVVFTLHYGEDVPLDAISRMRFSANIASLAVHLGRLLGQLNRLEIGRAHV